MKSLLLAIFVPLLLLGACSRADNAPLLFVQGATIGVKVSAGTAADPTPSIVFGYDAFEAASVPTLDGEGNTMGGRIPMGGADGAVAENAYSVYGGFGTDVEAEAGSSVALGITANRFFSTGLAADKLGDGEACRVSRGTVSHCTGTGGDAFAGIN